MLHQYSLNGYAFRLRPVGVDDAEFIVELRAGDPERTRYLHPVPPDVPAQREWLRRYLERENDYYWVIERMASGAAEGLVGVYDVNSAAQTGEWGRWVVRRGSLAAAESAWLVYRAAFEQLKLKSVYCITVAENRRVLSFHDSCGLKRVAVLPAYFTLGGGRRFDAVKHLCEAADWAAVRSRLEPQAELVARRLADSV